MTGSTGSAWIARTPPLGCVRTFRLPMSASSVVHGVTALIDDHPAELPARSRYWYVVAGVSELCAKDSTFAVDKSAKGETVRNSYVVMGGPFVTVPAAHVTEMENSSTVTHETVGVLGVLANVVHDVVGAEALSPAEFTATTL